MFSAITKQSRASLDTIMKSSSYGGLTVTTSPLLLHHQHPRPSFMSPTKCKLAFKWTCIKSEMLRFAGTPTNAAKDDNADSYSTFDTNTDTMREDLQSSKTRDNDKARKMSAGEGYGSAAPEEQEYYENMGASTNPGSSQKQSASSSSHPQKRAKSTDATRQATAHIKTDNSGG